MSLKHLVLMCSLLHDRASCWSSTIQLGRQRNINCNIVLLSKNEGGASGDSTDAISQILDTSSNNPTSAAFGVSFIGGDPCGSKYNDDPFDASKDVVKPGMPDEMKDRIAAMATELLKKQQNENKKGN